MNMNGCLATKRDWMEETENLFKKKNYTPPYVQPGVDVMITIFCDFRQFSEKKNWRFSQKPML
jgi:hypothetical protein